MGVRSSAEKIAKWREMIGAWSTSGKTQVAFCEEHGLDAAQMGYWKQRLAILDRPQSSPAQSASAFVRVMPQLASQSSTGIQISLPNQVALRIPSGAAEQDILTVLRALRGAA
ncbi:MAG: hypothetical protein A3E85_00500 [Gammaproteobacteria bacterium RIFCSPHIGHO2_12_FULL_45_12]|nr:MAG: hypothetical protein A3E85_00500 [Gammaproteobacteria bacterium RIFCSPHIGHO2_12_FULL_45_12]